ncbi:ANKL1 protein, partial [Piprites chloris]|nr:ANKL1 protein [Piprites chloris]
TGLSSSVGWGSCGCSPCPGRAVSARGGPGSGDSDVPSPQDGKRATDAVLERGWPLVEAPGRPRRALSFLTEDDSDGSVSSGFPEDNSEARPLSSTRRSLLEEQEPGGRCVPPLWQGRAPEPPSLPPWPQGDPRGSAVPPQPLASSTLLWDRDELQEGPPSWTGGGRTGRPPWAPPKPTPSSPLGGVGSSPGSSPTVLLCPGDQGHPQNPPSGPRGSPHPGVLEGGSGWQRHSSLGTPRFQWPHGSSRHLLAPQAPVTARGDPDTPSVPLSPPGCGPHCSGGHREDEGQGQPLPECHSPGTGVTPSPEDATGRDGRVSPGPLSDQSLRRRLRELGQEPGRHSPELVAALRTGHIPDCAQDELALARQFERPDRSRRWREGLLKSSFNYLLLDPRTTRDLPLRCPRLSPAQRFQTFVSAVFYVGKGTRARPYCHLAEALGQHRAGTRRGCPKVRRILEIWESGHGVVSVLCFQNRVPAEAYTREGCMVEALGLQTLTNQRKGHCYGVAAGWAPERRRRLGVHMLYRAMSIFLAEGERQLRPGDIPGG